MRNRMFLVLWIGGMGVYASPHADAQFESGPTPQPKGGPTHELPSEDDPLHGDPYTDYGSFREEEEEAEITQFFQGGRFFGVSAGLGFDAVTGNRGLLWQGGMPLAELKLHYWFDFNVALQMGLFTVGHYYDRSAGDRTNVNLFRLGVDIKYYFDVRNLSAAIAFSNPYVFIGGGGYYKTEISPNVSKPDVDIRFGADAGAGLEFPISSHKTYLFVEGKVNWVQFQDSTSSEFTPTIPNLSGFFVTATAGILFTW